MVYEKGSSIGSYRIIRSLGEGGMGAVYEVEHKKLGVHYALKTFTLDHGHVDLFRKRFLAEGKVLARLKHPNVARVFDLDMNPSTGEAYFVMDLIKYKDGESYTLADLENGGADEDYIADWFSQLASAVDYIHAEGIIHRDIKLNNLLLNEEGSVILSDFGISRFVGDKIRSEVDVTRTMISAGGRTVTGNLVMGTEGYMSPEIKRGEDATAASDTYAMGVAFFRLLTGIWYEPGTDVLKLLEPFNAGWMKILPLMLDADPARRPVCLTEVARELKISMTGDWDSGFETVAPVRETPERRRRTFRFAFAALGVVLAVLAGVALIVRGLEKDPPSVEDDIFYVPEGVR